MCSGVLPQNVQYEAFLVISNTLHFEGDPEAQGDIPPEYTPMLPNDSVVLRIKGMPTHTSTYAEYRGVPHQDPVEAVNREIWSPINPQFQVGICFEAFRRTIRRGREMAPSRCSAETRRCMRRVEIERHVRSGVHRDF